LERAGGLAGGFEGSQAGIEISHARLTASADKMGGRRDEDFELSIGIGSQSYVGRCCQEIRCAATYIYTAVYGGLIKLDIRKNKRKLIDV
jgi:hypothetical protein